MKWVIARMSEGHPEYWTPGIWVMRQRDATVFDEFFVVRTQLDQLREGVILPYDILTDRAEDFYKSVTGSL